MPEDREPYIGETDVVVGGAARPPGAVSAIIITRISNAKWTKDGRHVYVDLTDENGTTRTVALVPEIANHLIAALSTGIAGCQRVSRLG